MKGKFIVLEGPDGSGKSTQVRLLGEFFNEQELAVEVFKFPRKEKHFGAFIYECLDQEQTKYGNFLELSPFFGSLPYMLDQVHAKEELEEMLSRGHVVCDRYAESNLAHQAAKLPKAEWHSVISFIERGTYEEFGAPRADVIIHLDMPFEFTTQMLSQTGQAKDQLETDDVYRERVHEVYQMLAQERPEWWSVPCAKNGRRLTPEEVHKEVVDVVQSVIGVAGR